MASTEVLTIKSTMNEPLKDEKVVIDEEMEKAGGDAAVKDLVVKDVGQTSPAAKVVVHKSNFEKDIVYLYQFSRTPLLPSISPYCLKAETWLRLAGLKYENVDHKMKFRSKKGQLPFIELNGEEIADSSIIVKELAQKFNRDLDEHLTDEQRSISHATISMIENHLAWIVTWWRSKFPDQMLKAYKIDLQHALGVRIPNGILRFAFRFLYGRKWFQSFKRVKAQGIGVHSADEIMRFGQEDLQVLSKLLADKPFFFGDEPSNIDVVAFANLAQIYFIDKEVNFSLREYMVDNCANLVGLVNRMKERCFPDWDDICTNLDLNSHLPKPQPVSDDKEQKEQCKDEKEEKEPADKEKDLEKEKTEEKEKAIEK